MCFVCKAEFVFSPVDRILIAGRATWFYLVKLLWPSDLMFVYPRWRVEASVWWQVPLPLGVVALTVLLWKAGRHSGARCRLRRGTCHNRISSPSVRQRRADTTRAASPDRHQTFSLSRSPSGESCTPPAKDHVQHPKLVDLISYPIRRAENVKGRTESNPHP